MKTILIIDGDLVVFRNSAATEDRSIEVVHKASNKKKVFKNRTAFKDFLKEKNYPYDEYAYFIFDMQEPQDISHCLSLVKRQVENLAEFVWADEVEIYLGSGSTFRHKLPLPSPYKGNRSDMMKPVHLNAAREYLLKHHGARLAPEGLETDDIVTIRAYEELAKGNNAIIASLDKDQNQCSGVGILNWLDKPMQVKVMPEVGELYKSGNTVKGTGIKFLAYQTICSDPADNYCAYDLSDVKYGPSRAFNALKDCKTSKEVIITIIEQFKRLYPDPFSYTDHSGEYHLDVTWEDMMKIYFSCSYMKRSLNDPSDFWLFSQKFGVERKDYI